ncbi:hypothetical protein [Anaplasma platys]|nr:hypothetical protein [Anaplasma platys]
MYAKAKNKETSLGIDASAKRLSAVATGLVIAGTVLIICATAAALSYHLYCMRRNALPFGYSLGKLYLFLSAAVLTVTGILVCGIIAYAFRRRSVLLGYMPIEEETHAATEDPNDCGALKQQDASLRTSDEHDENCFSCMPDTMEDHIPERSLNVLERSDEHVQGKPVQEERKKEDLCVAHANAAASVPKFNSDGSVEPASRHIASGLFDYAIFALNSADIGEEQLNDIEKKKFKEVVPTSLQNRKIRAERNAVNSPFRIVTYSPRDGYPILTQDVQIIRRVRLPFGWRVNIGADVMIEIPRGSARKPADFVNSNVFYNVDMPVTYCNLLKLMFSYQAIRSGETERLFIRYLRFYYSELWEFAIEIKDEERRKTHLTGFDINGALYCSPIGARFVADIAQNYASFKVFMQEYKSDEETRVLFAFLESVRLCTPSSFAHPADVRSGLLYEAMCAIYGLSCRKSNPLFIERGLKPAVLMTLHYMFYFQETLRKALIINAILEETFTSEAESSFLCSQIYYLKNSVKTMLSVYDAKADRSTFDRVVQDLYSASEENKHLLAAMALSPGGTRLGLTAALEAVSGYTERLEEFRRLKDLAASPSSCFALSSDLNTSKPNDVFNCIPDVFNCIPYAVVSTIECLEGEEKASVIFDSGEGSRDVKGLLVLYRNMTRLVDSYFLECIWPYRKGYIGRGFYREIMNSKARGMYVLPVKEEFIGIRKILSGGCEEYYSTNKDADRNTGESNLQNAEASAYEKGAPRVSCGETARWEEVMASDAASSVQQLEPTTKIQKTLMESSNENIVDFSFSSGKPSRSVNKVSISGTSDQSKRVTQ